MFSLGTRAALAMAAGISTVALSACGGSALSASSSCRDFMNGSPEAQHQVIDQLASQYRKPAYATPLGEPEIPYYCSANSSTTLGQFFQRAEG